MVLQTFLKIWVTPVPSQMPFKPRKLVKMHCSKLYKRELYEFVLMFFYYLL